ncbi:MAG TPA: tripartite tricarboxylate transporter permease, partial [Casimicrobiaceae bacterium]|nr:tripartite tricarboxylate transporter permease [Casimicrobiaceae bacterium]
MLEVLQLLAGGFLHVLTPVNFAALVVGLVVGMLVAVLPGLTLVMGVVLALPFTYGMAITPSIILLTAMYVSGTYGGAITSILFRIPGEPMDVPLLWDGFAMARAGQPAQALGWTLFAALTGGLITATVMVTLAVPFAKVALTFDSPEYFSIVLFGFTSVVALGGGSMANALISLFFGMLVSTVGVDEIYGVDRFTFGSSVLRDGIGYLPVMVGAYGLGEVLTRLEQGFAAPPLEGSGRIATRIPSLAEAWRLRGTFARSSLVGVLCGIVPGAGATIASFVSYGIEGQYGKRRHQLGTGIPEGIIAPQVASTASVGGHMVPLLTLGIPGSGAT